MLFLDLKCNVKWARHILQVACAIFSGNRHLKSCLLVVWLTDLWCYSGVLFIEWLVDRKFRRKKVSELGAARVMQKTINNPLYRVIEHQDWSKTVKPQPLKDGKALHRVLCYIFFGFVGGKIFHITLIWSIVNIANCWSFKLLLLSPCILTYLICIPYT